MSSFGAEQFKNAIETYGREAVNRYGSAPDSVFEDTYRTVSEQHGKPQLELSAVYGSFESDLPGTMRRNSMDEISLRWYHHLERPTGPEGNDVIDVFTVTALTRSIASFSGHSKVYPVIEQLRSNHLSTDKPEVAGIKGKKIGRHAYEYSDDDLLDKLRTEVVAQPDRLEVGVARGARLPGALVELDPSLNTYLDIAQATARQRSLAPGEFFMAEARRHMQTVGVPASASNIETYYNYAFGYLPPSKAPEWLTSFGRERNDGKILGEFRTDCQQIEQFLGNVVIYSAARILELPSDMPQDFTII